MKSLLLPLPQQNYFDEVTPQLQQNYFNEVIIITTATTKLL